VLTATASMAKVRIPVAARAKVWVCGRSLAVTAGSNPAGGMDVSLSVVCCVRRADPSSRGVLSTVVCLSMIANPL
jgi:hypothetical protein